MLNNINAPITKLFAAIQNKVEDTAACTTPLMEREHIVFGGKERIYLNQLANRLTGSMINRLTADVVTEELITVYPVSTNGGKNPRPSKQSLNASLYTVGCYSFLMSGYTNADIIASATQNWFDDDSVKCEQTLDFVAIGEAMIKQFIVDGILQSDEGDAQMETGERFKAHGVTDEIAELRLTSIQRMWNEAAPKMQPLKFPVTWYANGTCDIKNLVIKEDVTQDFIDALNIMGHTAYTVNPAIKAELKRKFKRGDYTTKEEIRTVKAMLALDINTSYYFPHTSDYRGRIYARGGLTTFQGVKDLRAAFDFAETRPADEYGLFLHIANACGYDKKSITERLQWVKDNHISLMTVKRDNLYAERARLAYVEYKTSGLSNVICRIDGTCSGVQITSGLYLDLETAKAVNVAKSSPDDQPADLYGLVADEAIRLCRKAAERALLEKYHRDITKKVVMILAYGAGEDTLIDTVREFLSENKERTSYAKALQKVIMLAITTKYPAITRLNDHLQQELEENPQTKINYSLSDINVTFKGLSSDHLNIKGTNYTSKLVGKPLKDSDALARGIAPNFVHSLDSELLRKATRIMAGDVSCIHDDLGLHSNDVRRGLSAVRVGYYEVLNAQPMKEIYTALGVPDEYTYHVEDTASNGLKLVDVMESAYLFS